MASRRFGRDLAGNPFITTEGRIMTWGIPTDLFLQFHVFISLVAIAAGLVVFYGLLSGKSLPFRTALFLLTTILTSVNGFPLPPFGFDPPPNSPG